MCSRVFSRRAERAAAWQSGRKRLSRRDYGTRINLSRPRERDRSRVANRRAARNSRVLTRTRTNDSASTIRVPEPCLFSFGNSAFRSRSAYLKARRTTRGIFGFDRKKKNIESQAAFPPAVSWVNEKTAWRSLRRVRCACKHSALSIAAPTALEVFSTGASARLGRCI